MYGPESPQKRRQPIAKGDDGSVRVDGDGDEQWVAGDELAMWLYHEFIETAYLRQQQEYHWLELHERLRARPSGKSDGKGGSQAKIRISRTKSQQVTTRMFDMMFQGNANPWGITETPNPQLPDDVLNAAVMEKVRKNFEDLSGEVAELDDMELAQAVENGEMPDISLMQRQLNANMIPDELQLPPDELDEVVLQTARDRAEKMNTQIMDQSEEGGLQRQMRHCIKSGNNFGCGWIRGPFTKRTQHNKYDHNPETGKMESQPVETMVPEYDYRPIWDIYPYPHGVSEIDALVGVFDRSGKSKTQLHDLRDIEGYDAEAIMDYIALYPSGDMSWEYHWEQRRHSTNNANSGNYDRRGMYELIEFDGYLDGWRIDQYFKERSDDPDKYESQIDPHETFRVQVSVLGHRIIRLERLPWSRKVPVAMLYTFESDDTSIYGESVLDLGDDPDRLFQAVARAFVDDIGRAGHAHAVNMDNMVKEDKQHSSDIRDGRVLRYTGNGYDRAFNPIQTIPIPTNAGHLIPALNFAKQMMDESTGMPAIAGGETDGATEKTATAVSTRMQQANIVLKEPVHNFREGVLVPVVHGLYEWNMLYGEEDAKGDMAIKVTDIKALMAREQQHMIVQNILAMTANPLDAPHLDRNALLRALFEASDMDADRFVKDSGTVDKEQKAMQEQMQQGQAVDADQPGSEDQVQAVA